jgi:hypothetical protein
MGSVTNNTLSVFPVLCQDWRFIHMWKTGGRCGVWSARKTSLSPPILFQDRNVSGTPPLCIGVSVSIQERERSRISSQFMNIAELVRIVTVHIILAIGP